MTIKAQLEKLSAERDDYLTQAKALVTEAETSNDGLTDEISEKIDALTAQADTADGAIKELLERDKAIAAKLEKIGGFDDHSDSIASARGVHVPDTAPATTEAVAKIPATVRRYGNLTHFVGDVDGQSADERAYRFGQYALAKAAIDMPGKYRFPHAQQFASDQFGLQPFAVHSEGGGGTSNAHVFVPDEFGTDLIRLREMYGVARGVLKNRPMSSDTRTDPRWVSGLTAYFVAENVAGTESDTQWDDVRLTAKDLMCITRMSSQLSEDAVINFGDELAGEISYAFSNKEDQCAFNGDGTSTFGGIEGLRVAIGALTAGTAPGLTAAAGDSWGSITLANLESVVGSLPVYADVPGQVSWICHKTFYWTVMVKLALAAGGTTSTEIVNGVSRPVFLGYPVRYSQVYPSATAASQVPTTLGNYALGGSFGDRRQETIAFSTEATVGGQSLWERNQIGVKGTQRFDINIHDVGDASTAGPIVAIETTA